MKWWRRKPARHVDTDPDLARIRQELVWKFGEEIAYAIRLTGKDETTVGRPTWEPLSTHEALQHIDGLLSERFSLRTPHESGGPARQERPLDRLHDGRVTLAYGTSLGH